MERTVPKSTLWAGIVFILATGIIHLIDAPGVFQEMAYKGVLFALNGAGAIVAAVGIYRGSRTWGWMLGVLIAAGSIAGYIASRTIGMPGLPAEPDAWLEPLGVASMIAEALFLACAWRALSKPRAHANSEVAAS